MSIFSKLFGGSSPTQAASEDYNGYQITPTPVKEAHGFRIAAKIEKDGKTHDMIRADTYGSSDAANEASVSKAKQVIDQMGERMFAQATGGGQTHS